MAQNYVHVHYFEYYFEFNIKMTKQIVSNKAVKYSSDFFDKETISLEAYLLKIYATFGSRVKCGKCFPM